ncbi:hypothetical protein JOM56_012290 [Amanita muscaria]
MDGTAPASDIFDVRRTSPCYESEEESQEINESTCCAKEASQLLLEEKHIIARREEDLKSETEYGVIALNALSPIKQLSNDVLCHIFELHCKDSLPQVWGPPPPQITLSHVCSAWREIILDVRTFWSSIRIVPRDFDAPQTFVSMVKVANTWLSRAKGLSCSIDIDFSGDSESWASRRSLWRKDWHENIIKDLISLHKFKKLGVTFADHHLRDFLQLPDDKLSCVEDLCVRYISLNEDDAASPLDLYKLSNLTSFSLLPNPFITYPVCDPSPGYSKFASGIPWHNLRHIHLRATMPAPFCLDALEHCSAVLETCSLAITGDHTFTSSPRVPVHLSQLRELEVIACSLFRDEQILESFLLSLRFAKRSSLTLGSRDYPLDLEMLLQTVKACLRAGDRDGKHGIEVTKSKFVTLHCVDAEDEIEDEVSYFIKEIKLSGVDLNVVFTDYSGNESKHYSLDDYSDESYDDEAIYDNFAW